MIESYLIKNTYKENKYLRWIGDGITEYVCLKILEQHNKGVKNKMIQRRIENITEAKKERFNLLKWNPINHANEPTTKHYSHRR